MRHLSSPEFQLLTWCVRARSESADQAIAQLLRQRLAWRRFLFLAEKNQVVPLVYRRLDAFSSELREDLIRKLRCRSVEIVSWNLLLASELKEVLALFAVDGIAAVPFKGPALGLALYGELGLRQGDDLDIFLEPDDLGRATTLLRERGYRLPDPGFRAGTQNPDVSVKDVVVENPATGVRIELHWAICEHSEHREIRDFSPCRRACGELEFFGSHLRIASSEDTLLMLSVHGMRHYWNRLKWICDIGRLLQVCPEFDWERLLKTADAFSCRRTLLLPHLLIRDLLGISPPASLSWMAQHDASLRPLVRRIGMDLAADADAPVWPQCRPMFKQFAEIDVAQKLFRLRSKDSVPERLNLFSNLICDFVRPEASDLQRWPFLSRMKFIFWIIQPLRIARACGLRFFFRTSRQLLAALMP